MHPESTHPVKPGRWAPPGHPCRLAVVLAAVLLLALVFLHPVLGVAVATAALLLAALLGP